MSTFIPDSDSLSYSARFCRRCHASMSRRRGFLGRTQWRCEQCKPTAVSTAR